MKKKNLKSQMKVFGTIYKVLCQTFPKLWQFVYHFTKFIIVTTTSTSQPLSFVRDFERSKFVVHTIKAVTKHNIIKGSTQHSASVKSSACQEVGASVVGMAKKCVFFADQSDQLQAMNFNQFIDSIISRFLC